MANTERLKVIQMVREARNAVNAARFNTKVKAAERRALDDAFVALDDLEGTLILKEVKERVDALVADSTKLEEMAAEMKKSLKHLEAIGEMIEKAAKGIKFLVDIATKASSAGIL
jgi:hypothetical protein